VFKDYAVTIIQPFFQPEVIRASEWLPHGASWAGHATCP
jgi:hypothetical protein